MAKPVSIEDDIAVASKEHAVLLLRHLDKVEHLHAEHLQKVEYHCVTVFKSHVGFYLVIADSVQTEYCSTFLLSVRVFVRVSVTGVTSHISHIYKGINAMLIIRGPIKPYKF